VASTLPIDVESLRYGTWNRRPSDAWTNLALRVQIVATLDAFVIAHNWADAWDATERFTDTGINVRVPRTPPVQPAEVEDFKQRNGIRILVLGVTRDGTHGFTPERFEVALSFPMGNEDPLLPTLLDIARRTLEAEHARTP
jgi:hypothetical protein